MVLVIFLPLSFFTSYFGMNVVEFTGQSGNTSVYTFWRYGGSLSAATVAVSLLLAFNQGVRETSLLLLRRVGFLALRPGDDNVRRGTSGDGQVWYQAQMCAYRILLDNLTATKTIELYPVVQNIHKTLHLQFVLWYPGSRIILAIHMCTHNSYWQGSKSQFRPGKIFP